MDKRPEKQISDAVKECLGRCYASGNTPLGAIAEYVAELRGLGWSDTDVMRVELSARKVLAGVIGGNGGNSATI